MKAGEDLGRNCTIVTITDSNFVLAVFILVLSLKYHKVNAKIRILSLGLTAKEKEFFTQFDEVFVHESKWKTTSNKTNFRAVVNLCKREAVLLATEDQVDNVALLDGDCIVTGDITKYINPKDTAMFVRTRSAAEDNMIFMSRYESGDKPGSIPQKVLNAWKADNNSEHKSAIEHTSLSGNFVVNKKFLPFITEWGDLMEKVLPHSQTEFNHVAYEMMGDFSLSAALAYGQNKPPIRDILTDKDPDAYIAHLGPTPKFWKLWPIGKLKFLQSILILLDWSDKNGLKSPTRTWTLRRKYLPLIYLTAYFHYSKMVVKEILRPMYKSISPKFKDRIQKY